jgi:ankyrin repeat protein
VLLSLKLRKLDSAKLRRGFHLACINGMATVVERLLQEPDVDPSQNFSFAFCEASRLGHARVVKCLLADGRADPTANGSEALRHAIQNEHVAILKLLLKDGRADPGEAEGGFILEACARRSCAVILLLLDDTRVDPSVPDNQPFNSLCTREDLGDDLPSVVTRFLSDERVDPAADDNKAFINACRHGQVTTVQILLADPRVDPTTRHNQGLCHAIYNDLFDVVRVLLTDKRVDFAPQGAERLWEGACKHGDARIVRDLLNDARLDLIVPPSKAFANVLTNTDHFSGVVNALLLDGQCDPSAESYRLLMSAIKRDDEALIKVLLQDKRVNPAASDTVWVTYAIDTPCTIHALDLMLLDERVDAHSFLHRAFNSTVGNYYTRASKRNIICTNEHTKRMLFKHKYSADVLDALSDFISAQASLSKRVFVLCVERMYRCGGRHGRRVRVVNDVVRSIVCDWLAFRIEKRRVGDPCPKIPYES